MSTTAHTAKPAAPTQTGRFATLRGPLPGQGSGAPMRTPVAVMVSLCALVVAALTAGPAFALNPERNYEMVSPLYKAGYGVGGAIAGALAAPNGESVVYESLGSFAGSDSTGAEYPYLARRGLTGWETTPIDTPAALAPEGGLSDFSANLESSISESKLGASAQAAHHGVNPGFEFFWHQLDTPDAPASWEGQAFKTLEGTPLTSPIEYVAASTDLCHLVINSSGETLLPAAANTKERLYELSRGCNGETPGLRVLGVDNTVPAKVIATPQCEAFLGADEKNELGRSSAFNAVSADGSEVFFGTHVGPGEECGAGTQLFVRLSGARTVEVSKPLGEECSEVPCPGAATRPFAAFEGASEDGSKVFFTTAAPLGAEDRDAGNDLYMAEIGCPAGEEGCVAAQREVTSLVQISHSTEAGEAAEMQGVVSVAPDGSRVYFVAHGVLRPEANARGLVPLKGAENLYVYDSVTGQLAFVADLCSGPGLSGTVEDARCPLILEEAQGVDDDPLWAGSNGALEAQANVCGRPSASECVGERETGRFLVFSTYGQLLPGDTDNARDVYRYDAVTGALARVSIGEEGADANGNRDDSPVEPLSPGGITRFADASIAAANLSEQGVALIHQLGSRAVSEDGSRIVFTTAEPLSPSASNGLPDIYEWHKEPAWDEGRVSLISGGSSLTPDAAPVITPSGRDVFFKTSQGLVSGDTDGENDIYDARLGGGFPVPPAERLECSEEGCRGPLTNPVPLLVPGSVSQASGENLSAPVVEPVKAKAKAKGKKKGRKKVVRKHARNKRSSKRKRS